MGEGNGYFVLSTGKSSGNALVVYYWKLPMGRNDTRFGLIYQNILVRFHALNYKEMFAQTPIYIGYIVLTIVIFTSMIPIELFYLTQLCSFLGYSLINYLSLSLTGLHYIIENV